MAKTAFYIDGFNLYHSIDALGNDRLKWLNLWKLAVSFLRPEDSLNRVMYFTAYMKWEPEKFQRHRAYVAALEASGVECIISEFQKTKRHCRQSNRSCGFHDEKKTDVEIATRILVDCHNGDIGRIILLTADSDQVPTVAAVRGVYTDTTITIACPPGRKRIARELCSVAHDFREISEGRLLQCLFPRDVKDENGKTVARSPAKYQPPRY